MKFGVREICDVVFKAKSPGKIGSMAVVAGQPVLYIDSAKTSTLEGAATSVYAQGGRGNARLISWEGEKTLTFTVEDALLSPIGFSILSGAGLLSNDEESVHVHTTAHAYADKDGNIDLTDVLGAEEEIDGTAPVFVMTMEEGSITGMAKNATISEKVITTADAKESDVFVDFYVLKKSKVTELQIDAENFAGNYYVEASTLFRRESDGKDLPAEITLPNVKIQSNFTFSMASTGDPSTFTFTMDAFPGYTAFDRTKKVLCVIQVVEDAANADKELKTVMGHVEGEKADGDSYTPAA